MSTEEEVVYSVDDEVVEEEVPTEAVVVDVPIEAVVVEEDVVVEEAVTTEETVVVEEVVTTEEAVEEDVVEEDVVEEDVVEEDVVDVPTEDVVVVEEVVVDVPTEAVVVEEVVTTEETVEEAVVVDVPTEAVVDVPTEAVVVDVPTEAVVDVPTEAVVDVPTEAVVDVPVVEVVAEVPAVTVPKLVFIVPYRDRLQQQLFFAVHMKKILEDYPVGDYKIFYIHQKDTRSFNRGAMKNIGFLYVKQTYPNDYKNITLVFNDVDTMPMTKGFFDYETTVGKVKHFYGYTFTLGGIVSIKASDYELINGFPNYWAWGFEDNSLQKRVENANLTIDRSQFYKILDKNVMQLKDGIERMVNRNEYDKYIEEVKYKTLNDGWSTIANLAYSVDNATGFVDVVQFTTAFTEKPELNQQYDLRNGLAPFKMTANQRRSGRSMMRMGGGMF